MKKRLLAVLLSAVMALSLGACGDSGEGNADKDVKQPSITKIADYKDITVILNKVAEENADAYFNQLVYGAGIGIIEVTDRDTVQKGDIVKTDYTGYVDGKPFKGGSTITDGKSNAQYIDVDNNAGFNISTGATSGGFIDKFTDGLIGAKKNEDKSTKVKFPKGYGDTTLLDDDKDSSNDVKVSLSEKEVTFVFNVKGIYQKTTPENLTDALVVEKFSKEYGVKTVAEFMNFVKTEAEKVVFESYFNNVIYSAGISTVEVKDRDTVQKGDIVKIDYTGTYKGTQFKAGSAMDQWVDVDNNCVINLSTGSVTEKLNPGFSAGLIGMKVNEEKDHNVVMPKNYGQTTLLDGDKDPSNDVKVDLSNQTVNYKLKVKKIYMQVTQETITDAIVKEYFEKSYKVTTVDAFIKALKEELVYNDVITYIIDNSTFDIPESYVNYRVDGYQKLFEELYCGGQDIKTVLSSYYGITLDNARTQWAASLKSQIKAELVFAEVVKAESLKVDEKEKTDYINDIKAAASEENGNEFLKKEENIYKMIGSGDKEAGEKYLENQNSTRTYFVGLYNALEAK